MTSSSEMETAGDNTRPLVANCQHQITMIDHRQNTLEWRVNDADRRISSLELGVDRRLSAFEQRFETRLSALHKEQSSLQLTLWIAVNVLGAGMIIAVLLLGSLNRDRPSRLAPTTGDSVSAAR